MKTKTYEVKTFLSEEYIEQIDDEIKKNNVLCIEGGTGIGKTQLIRNLAMRHNAIIATPFLAMRNLYNPIQVIESENFNEFYKGNACVMVYDRLYNIADDKLNRRIIFIDESHLLFTDRTYRARLVGLMNKLLRIKKNIKIVLVSATSLDELKILECETILKFNKKRDTIKMVWDATNTPYFSIEKHMNAALMNKKYDHVVVFSDSCVRALYDSKQLELVDKCNDVVAMLHSEYKNLGDIDRITKSEMLDKRLTLCTSLGFNGLNFKNLGEHVMIIVDIRLGRDTAWKIIQCIGRIRKSTVGCLVVASKGDDRMTVEERRIFTKTFSEAGATHDIFSYGEDIMDDNYYNAMLEIEKYINEHSTTDKIQQALKDTGYIEIHQLKEKNEFVRKKNPLKEKMSNVIKEQIMDSTDIFSTHLEPIENVGDETNGKEYYDNMLSHTNRIMTDKGLNVYMLQYMMMREQVGDTIVGAYDKQQQIITIIDNLRQLLNVVEHPGDISEIERELKISWDKHKDQLIIKRQKSQLDKIKRMNKRYGDKIITNCEIYNLFHGGEGYCKMGVLNAYKQDLLAKQHKSAKGRLDAHTRAIEIGGVVYGSIIEAAEKTGKTKRTIHNWLKSGEAKYAG